MRTRTEIKIDFTCIRHGATASNERHCYLGKTEESLSDSGIAVLREKKKDGRHLKPEYLFASPMKRCQQTAEILYPDLQPILIPEWKEMDFGRFEGKNYKELQGNVEYQRWIDSNGTLPFPGGEDQQSFIRRTGEGFKRMLVLVSDSLNLPDIVYGGEALPVVVIVHGGTIMALLSSFTGGDYFSYQTANAGGYRCLLACRGTQIELLKIEELL